MLLSPCLLEPPDTITFLHAYGDRGGEGRKPRTYLVVLLGLPLHYSTRNTRLRVSTCLALGLWASRERLARAGRRPRRVDQRPTPCFLSSRERRGLEITNMGACFFVSVYLWRAGALAALHIPPPARVWQRVKSTVRIYYIIYYTPQDTGYPLLQRSRARSRYCADLQRLQCRIV